MYSTNKLITFLLPLLHSEQEVRNMSDRLAWGCGV